MRYTKKLPVILLCILLLMGILLTGCRSKKPVNDSSAKNGDKTAATTAFDGDTEEDTSVISTIIDQSWDNYEITANEIGYDPNAEYLDENGYYTSEEDVATYIIEYGTLPDNFITKKEARALGWSGGGLDDYAEDCSIGGDYFGNYEGLLPEVDGRVYYECDIDTMNARKRGSKRIIYSNDGQIYYTDDHYESFTLLYGTDDPTGYSGN